MNKILGFSVHVRHDFREQNRAITFSTPSEYIVEDNPVYVELNCPVTVIERAEIKENVYKLIDAGDYPVLTVIH